MRPRSPQGFTLIELLVVIAIIAILSAVVLGSFVLGRARSSDANIKANLHTIADQAELYYSNNSNFGGTVLSQLSALTPATMPTGHANLFETQDATVNAAFKAALAQGGQGYFAVGASSWAAEIQMKTNTSNWWCVDSSGMSKITTTAGGLGGGSGTAACP